MHYTTKLIKNMKYYLVNKKYHNLTFIPNGSRIIHLISGELLTITEIRRMNISTKLIELIFNPVIIKKTNTTLANGIRK